MGNDPVFHSVQKLNSTSFHAATELELNNKIKFNRNILLRKYSRFSHYVRKLHYKKKNDFFNVLTESKMQQNSFTYII